MDNCCNDGYILAQCEMTGYKLKTTFGDDFLIASNSGESAIRDTYERAFNDWKDDIVYITELSLILNWNIWKFYENGNEALARVYDELWKKLQGYVYECDENDNPVNYTDEQISYYWETTD